MALLEVKNLVKAFPGRVMTAAGPKPGFVRAVDDVSISVDVGETLGLVGESGCGKTTLSRCILRLEDPTSGAIVFSGTDISHLKGSPLKSMRREMQIVFQDPFASLDPRWTVGRTIDEPLALHNIVPRTQRKSEVERLLTSVGLPASVANRYPHEFSGGQRQRIGIARALALHPKFLIADEPVSALDVSVRAQILNLLRDAQKHSNLGMLFIAHDLAAVRQVSRRIAVMYLGRIVEEGFADSLFENPRHPYTRTLLDAIPTVRRFGAKQSDAKSEKSDFAMAIDLTTGCRFRNRCGFAQDICGQQEPPNLSLSAGHWSACHFAMSLPQYNFDQSLSEVAL